MLDGVIFDFDGVLVDTVDDLFNVYWEIIGDLGLKNSDQDTSKLNGLTIRQICNEIIRINNIAIDFDDLLSMYYKKLDRLYSYCEVIDSSVNLVKFLYDKKTTLSIASGCPEKYIHMVLNRIGVYKYFEEVVGSDSITNGKPDPEVFFRCMKRSGFKTAMVIDDSESGVLSAIRAGCCVTKFDENIKSKKNINDFIIHQINNNISYLGEIKNLGIISSVTSYDLSSEEEEIWKNLEQDGSYNAPLQFVDFSLTESIESLVTKERDYRYFRVINESCIAVAVTGVVSDNNKILLGKRSKNTYQYSEEYDFVPAGSLETNDYIQQLNIEWREEGGFKAPIFLGLKEVAYLL